MTRKWVINASPLILLGKISRIDLIKDLCQEIIIPKGVEHEIYAGDDSDPAKIWLRDNKSIITQDVTRIDSIVAAWDLSLGESHVISWCYQNRECEAILDDAAARKCAQTLNIPVRGTLGIILLAKKENKITKAKPLLEELLTFGFRIDIILLKSALKLVNE